MPRKRALLGKEKELIELYQAGWPFKKIADHFGCTESTVRLELDRLGVREIPSRQKMIKHFQKIQHEDEFFFYLGVIWGLGSMLGEKLAVRTKQKDLLLNMANYMKYVSGPYQASKEKPDQWQIHFRLGHPIYECLESLGWQPRSEKDRDYPDGDVNDDEFIRGFVRVHHSLDKIKLKGKYADRLRIYGGEKILRKIDDFFVDHLGTTPKKVQRHGRSDVCHILYYQSKREIPILRQFLGI